MYDIKQNWFYKMCAKQCTKDFALIFVGGLLVIAGILLFTAVISVMNIALMIVGIIMSVNGASAFISKLPKLRDKMQSLSADELNSLGSVCTGRSTLRRNTCAYPLHTRLSATAIWVASLQSW